MPDYDFQHEDGEVITVFVPLSAEDEQRLVQTVNGRTYKRVYGVPRMAVDMGTRIGDATQQDFNRITGNKQMNVGDAWEISRDMHEKRKSEHGRDPVQEAQYAKHEKETGEKHPAAVRRDKVEASNAKLKEMGITLKI